MRVFFDLMGDLFLVHYVSTLTQTLTLTLSLTLTLTLTLSLTLTQCVYASAA